MITQSYCDYWLWNLERNRQGEAECLAMDPFKGWENDRMPESASDIWLQGATERLYAGADDDTTKAFLHLALVVAQRTLDEDKLLSSLCEFRFPENRGRLYRSMAYTNALLTGKLDNNLLLQAAADYEAWWHQLPRGERKDDIHQAQYLNAVRLRVIAGDIDSADKLLRAAKLKRHPREVAVMSALIDSLQETNPPAPGVIDAFDSFFDEIRNPRTEFDEWMETYIARFELGLIRDKYIEPGDGTIDVRRVIEVVSR